MIIKVQESAKKDLKKIDKVNQKRLLDALKNLKPDYALKLLYICQMLCFWVFVKKLSLTRRLIDVFLQIPKSK